MNLAVSMLKAHTDKTGAEGTSAKNLAILIDQLGGTNRFGGDSNQD